MTGTWRRYRTLPRNVVAIGLVSFLNDASSEIIYPLLPLFLALSLGAPPLAIGAIEGAAETVSSILKLFAGYLSDRLGKRKALVVFGYGMASLARVALAVSKTWPQVLGLRILDRVGKGIRGAPRDALIADSVAEQSRGIAFGLHRAMDHAGAVVGPLLGLAILTLIASNPNEPTEIEYKTVFLVAAIPAAASVLVAYVAIKDVAKHANGKPDVKPPKLSLVGFDSNFKRFLCVLILFTLSNSSDAFILLRAKESGIPTSQIPILWAVHHVVKVVASLAGGDMADRLGRKALIVSGWIVYAAVYAGFGFANTPVLVWSLFLVYGIYFGMAEGAEKALVADLVQPEQRGTAYGLYNLAMSVTLLPASILMGELWQIGGPKLAFCCSATISLSAASFLIFVRTRPQALEITDAPSAND